MAKRYIRLNWQNAPSVATPINAVNLNKMDKGIDDIDEALDALESSIISQIVNDPTKINNAAVNYAINEKVDTLTNNLAVQTWPNLTQYMTPNVQSITSGYILKFGNMAILSVILTVAEATSGVVLFTNLPVSATRRTEFLLLAGTDVISRGNISGPSVSTLDVALLKGKVVAFQIVFVVN